MAMATALAMAMAIPSGETTDASLCCLPDELLLRVLSFLDVSDLLSVSRTCRFLKGLSRDPQLHRGRLRSSLEQVSHLLPRRPRLRTLQPPVSTIYLTQTHLAARRLHWSLVRIRLSRSLARRPALSALVSANILPGECCRRDRQSGEFVWGSGVAGALVERRRRVEREQIKEGLRVWLERKACEIRARRTEDDDGGSGGVAVLIWRFSRKKKVYEPRLETEARLQKPDKEKVSRLRRFFEGLGNGRSGG